MSANHKRNNCIVIILIKLEKYRINLAGASLTNILLGKLPLYCSFRIPKKQ